MAQPQTRPADAGDAVATVAERLRAAEASGVPCAPVRDLLPEGDVAAAYRVQTENVGRRIAAGARLIGRKIGLTSRAVQMQLGVDQPDYGALLSDMVVEDGGRLAQSRVLQPKAEAEIAFVLDRDLDMEAPNVADVLRATAYVLPSIEIVGSRIADWNIRLADTVADNASSAMFVLGTPARRPADFDFTGCEMQMTIGEETASTGAGRACLGNPLNAVVWLAARMQEIGTPLKAGEIVLSGALGPMVALVAPGRVAAEIAGLGRVSFEFGEASA